MSIMTKFDKTSPIHRMVFEVRKSWELRRRWREDFDALALEYGLNKQEVMAVRNCDLVRLHELGVHPFYYNPIIRLTHGEDWDEFQPTTVEIMKRTYGAVADPESYSTSPAQRS
jgi:Aromatic-ring-opening dioxygenase LigAB, LigA subunit